MRNVIVTHGLHKKTFVVPTADEWDFVASEVLADVRPGDVVTLAGPLGAGKTTFVQAIARALKIQKTPQSPTFALLRSYDVPGRSRIKRLLHVDAYRLENEREMMVLDLDEELADGKSILLMEWPERVQGWVGRIAHERLHRVEITMNKKAV